MTAINPAGKYILKNHVVGRKPNMTPINEYIIYDESLKAIQFIHCSVTEIKEKLALLESPPSAVSAAWLDKQGAFSGKR